MLPLTSDYVETSSGIAFDFENPTEDMFNIEDIAASLSKQCRFNGHTHTFYSVAEHCIHIEGWLAENRYNVETRLCGLLHDAVESVIGDMVRPIKHKMPKFLEIEHKLESIAFKKFGLLSPFPPIIKEIDTRIIRDEREQAMNPSNNVWATDDLEPLGVDIEFWYPGIAEKIFLDTYDNLQRTVV